MKITKRQLRRIIKEEKAKVLAEQKVRRIVRRRLQEAYMDGGHGDFKSWVEDPAYHEFVAMFTFDLRSGADEFEKRDIEAHAAPIMAAVRAAKLWAEKRGADAKTAQDFEDTMQMRPNRVYVRDEVQKLLDSGAVDSGGAGEYVPPADDGGMAQSIEPKGNW